MTEEQWKMMRGNNIYCPNEGLKDDPNPLSFFGPPSIDSADFPKLNPSQIKEEEEDDVLLSSYEDSSQSIK